MTLKQELEAVQYQKLKVKFAELGIPQVWKSGTKKVVMIENALEILERVNEDTTTEEIIEEIAQEKELASKTRLEVAQTNREKAIAHVIANKQLWTKESMERKIKIYGNIFLQHKLTIKGKEALERQEVLQEAIKILF